MGSKVLVKPLSGGKPFTVDASEAPAYNAMVDSDGAAVYTTEPIDAVYLEKGSPTRAILDPDQQKNFLRAGREMYTSQEAYNAAAQVDKKKGEDAALDSGSAKLAAFGRIPGLSKLVEDGLLGEEDAATYRQMLKSGHPYLGAAGDIARTVSTLGAAGVYSAGAGLVGYAGNAGKLAQIVTGIGLGAAGGAAENTTLEILHALDNDKPLTSELLLNAAGTGAMWGGIAAGAIPAAAAIGRGVRAVGGKVIKNGPTGWITKKVFGHFEDSAATHSAQREAYEKALVKEQAEIGKFTPEGFRRIGTESGRREFLERIRGLGSTVDVGYDEARLAADRLKKVETTRKAMDTHWKGLSPKMRDRIGDPEWRKSFEYTVKDVDGKDVVRWGWNDESWSVVEEEMRSRFSALSEGGYSTEARYLEELLTPAHKNSPGVVAGRLNQAYMQYGMDALAGKQGAEGALEVVKSLLHDGDVWGRRAAKLNEGVTRSMDDVLSAIKNIRSVKFPDRFDMVTPQTVQAYKTLPVLSRQLDDALATLNEANILNDSTVRTLRSNMTEYHRAFSEGAEAAETASKMAKARTQALELNKELLGKNTAPAIGADTAVSIARTGKQLLDSVDEAVRYVGHAIEDRSFQNKFARGRIGVYAVRELDDKDRRDLYDDVAAMVQQYAQDPYSRMERIGRSVERVAATDTGIADELAGQLDEQMGYLAEVMPVTPLGAYGLPLPPADSEIDSFLEVVAAMQSWPAVVATVSDGTVTYEAAAAMRNLAPSLYNRVRGDLAQVIEAMDPFDVDDKVQSGINIFMGELDPVYTPDFIRRLQDPSAQTSQLAAMKGQQQQPGTNPNALTSVPQHQNPQSGITPGTRLGSY